MADWTEASRRLERALEAAQAQGDGARPLRLGPLPQDGTLCFFCGELPVRLCFAPEGPALEALLAGLLLGRGEERP